AKPAEAPKSEAAKREPPKADAKADGTSASPAAWSKPDGTSASPAAWSKPETPLASHVKAAVDAADRDADDKSMDVGRKPGTLLDFCGVPQGGKVAESAAGGGYTAELLARAVGP